MTNVKKGETFSEMKNMIASHLKEYISENSIWGPPDPLTDLPTYLRKTPTLSSPLAGRVVCVFLGVFIYLYIYSFRLTGWITG